MAIGRSTQPGLGFRLSKVTKLSAEVEDDPDLGREFYSIGSPHRLPVVHHVVSTFCGLQ